MPYLLAFITIIIINLIPAFMPPTWIIVSYFYIEHKVNLELFILLAVGASATGRWILANYTGQFFNKFFNKRQKGNMSFLRKLVNKSPIQAFSLTFVYSLLFLPTNNLFLSLGAAKTKLRSVIVGFILGRAINYYLLAKASKWVIVDMAEVFVDEMTQSAKILIEIASIFSFLLIMIIDWEKLLTKRQLEFNLRIF